MAIHPCISVGVLFVTSHHFTVSQMKNMARLPEGQNRRPFSPGLAGVDGEHLRGTGGRKQEHLWPRRIVMSAPLMLSESRENVAKDTHVHQS